MMGRSVHLLTVLVVIFCTALVSGDVCLSDTCRNVSQYILSNLNTSVVPCVDMYTYSCGGWMQLNDLPVGSGKWTKFHKLHETIQMQLIQILEENGWLFKGRNSEAVRKLKQFYRSCTDVRTLNQKGAQPVIKLIDELGSWTVTPTNQTWNRTAWSLELALQQSHNLTGIGFMSMDIKKDSKNGSRNIIFIYQRGLTMPNAPDYLTPRGKNKYMRRAMAIGRLLGGCNKTVETRMNQVFYLEKALSRIFLPKHESRNPKKIYNLMNVSEFQNLIGPWINIQQYMDAILGDGVVSAGDEINVQTTDYFRQLQQVIKTTNHEVLANYIVWSTINPTFGYLSEEFSEVDLFDSQPVENIVETNTLQKNCLEKSKLLAPWVTSALYVDRHFSQDLTVKVVTALRNIKIKFVANLDQLSWMDELTKRNLTEKVTEMIDLVGYPDWIMNPSRLDAEYADLVVEEGEFFQNFINQIVFKKKVGIKQLSLTPQRNTWLAYPHEVNGKYNIYQNQVFILAGLLNKPFFSTDYPRSYFYGILGGILAHEVMHGFDSRGRMHDKFGDLKDIWTPNVAEEYYRRAQCFIEQYNGYDVLPGHNISGSLTLAENIADNGGIKMAFRAYKSSIGSDDFTLPGLNMTSDQLFFVGFGNTLCAKYSDEYSISSIQTDVHSKTMFRVIGTVSNSREFSAAFNCPLNSPMNPVNKCEIW
ncbi:Endothelin-converting enzyme 1 [Bulinus truncatus]|nr:Endothelin-converting enzyme 1 [Bulinus truncatus]